MLLSILVNDNQAKLLFLQPQFQDCLEFLFCIQFINVHFLSQFFSGWFAIFLISFISSNAQSLKMVGDPWYCWFFHRIRELYSISNFMEKCHFSWIWSVFFHYCLHNWYVSVETFFSWVLHIRGFFSLFSFLSAGVSFVKFLKRRVKTIHTLEWYNNEKKVS